MVGLDLLDREGKASEQAKEELYAGGWSDL
jgi:hypothetical protein